MRPPLRTASLTAVVGLAVALSACSGSSGGGSGQTPTTSSSPSSSTPVEGPVNPAAEGPAPKDVPGYTLAPAPDAARATFQNLVTGSQGTYKGLSVYTVAKGANQIGGLALLDVDPKIVTNPQVDATLATTLVKALTAGAAVTTRRVDGLDVVEATVSGSTFAAWYDGDVVSLMVGANARQTNAFVDAYIRA